MAFTRISPGIELSHSANKASIAYNVARSSWYEIVNSVIQTVEDAVTNREPDSCLLHSAGVMCGLRLLRQEIESDSAIPPLLDDDRPDVDQYCTELALFHGSTWHSSPWLFTECYLFRRLAAIFAVSNDAYWRTFDSWSYVKQQSLKTSLSAVVELSEWFQSIEFSRLHDQADKDCQNTELRILTSEAFQASLWGNRADLLSFLTTENGQMPSDKATATKQELRSKVLVDDTESVFELLIKFRNASYGRSEVHIILDNAGPELFSDLILAAFLIAAGNITKVVLHGKSMPWFMSDATATDLQFMLQTISRPNLPKELPPGVDAEAVTAFYKTLVSLMDSGRIQFVTHTFWTTAHPIGRVHNFAPDLYVSLNKAELVIFKGDLNYRKLVHGGMWPPTTTFERALGQASKLGIRILALRVCKGDTCVGIGTEQLNALDPEGHGYWTRTGEFGVISFFDGKVQNRANR